MVFAWEQRVDHTWATNASSPAFPTTNDDDDAYDDAAAAAEAAAFLLTKLNEQNLKTEELLIENNKRWCVFVRAGAVCCQHK